MMRVIVDGIPIEHSLINTDFKVIAIDHPNNSNLVFATALALGWTKNEASEIQNYLNPYIKPQSGVFLEQKYRGGGGASKRTASIAKVGFDDMRIKGSSDFPSDRRRLPTIGSI